MTCYDVSQTSLYSYYFAINTISKENLIIIIIRFIIKCGILIYFYGNLRHCLNMKFCTTVTIVANEAICFYRYSKRFLCLCCLLMISLGSVQLMINHPVLFQVVVSNVFVEPIESNQIKLPS